jgi:hypothetical protein
LVTTAEPAKVGRSTKLMLLPSPLSRRQSLMTAKGGNAYAPVSFTKFSENASHARQAATFFSWHGSCTFPVPQRAVYIWNSCASCHNNYDSSALDATARSSEEVISHNFSHLMEKVFLMCRRPGTHSFVLNPNWTSPNFSSVAALFVLLQTCRLHAELIARAVITIKNTPITITLHLRIGWPKLEDFPSMTRQ